MRTLLPVLLLIGLAVAACSSKSNPPQDPQPTLDEMWRAAGDKPLKIDPRWLVIELREHGGEWRFHVNGSSDALDAARLEGRLLAYADLSLQIPTLPGRGPNGVSENPVVLRAPPHAPARVVTVVLEWMATVRLYRVVVQLSGARSHQALLELPHDDMMISEPLGPEAKADIRFSASEDSVSLICEAVDKPVRQTDFRPSELHANRWDAELYKRKREAVSNALIELQGKGSEARKLASVEVVEGSAIPFVALMLALDAIHHVNSAADRDGRPRMIVTDSSAWHIPLPPEEDDEFPE